VNCLPHKTVAAMRPDDIAIQITVAVEHPSRGGHTCNWPPNVTRRAVSGPFEGLPARIGGFQCVTRVGTREVSVFIVFGRAAPTQRQLNRVNAELRRVHVG
jgi:hypothetical protein